MGRLILVGLLAWACAPIPAFAQRDLIAYNRSDDPVKLWVRADEAPPGKWATLDLATKDRGTIKITRRGGFSIAVTVYDGRDRCSIYRVDNVDLQQRPSVQDFPEVWRVDLLRSETFKLNSFTGAWMPTTEAQDKVRHCAVNMVLYNDKTFLELPPPCAKETAFIEPPSADPPWDPVIPKRPKKNGVNDGQRFDLGKADQAERHLRNEPAVQSSVSDGR